MQSKNFNDGNLFEREVRTIARELWPTARYHGAQNYNGRERDGIFECDDIIHCLECTISRDEKKTRQDINKLKELVLDLRAKNQSMAVKGWFVTLHELTADQSSHLKSVRGLINHETFDSFRSKLIRASDYLTLRAKYPFGSARNVRDNSVEIPSDEFIDTYLFPDNQGKPLSVSNLARLVAEQNSRFIILGEYGVGKSMTLRQLYFLLSDRYKRGNDLRFPIYMNLRDHQETTDVAEAFRKHARSIGYNEETHIVRAFRSGYTYLI